MAAFNVEHAPGDGRQSVLPGAQAVSVQDPCNLLIRTDAHQQLDGFHTNWTLERVASLRKVRDIAAYSPERRELEGWLILTQAAAFLGVSTTTLRLSAERREPVAIHSLPNGPWIFKL